MTDCERLGGDSPSPFDLAGYKVCKQISLKSHLIDLRVNLSTYYWWVSWMKDVSIPNTSPQCIKYKCKCSSNTGLQSHTPLELDHLPTYPAPTAAHFLGLARSKPVFYFDCLCSHNTSFKVRSIWSTHTIIFLVCVVCLPYFLHNLLSVCRLFYCCIRWMNSNYHKLRFHSCKNEFLQMNLSNLVCNHRRLH